MIIYFFIFFPIINAFININFGPSFKISNYEISKDIKYKLNNHDTNKIKNISGFYGLIGPNKTSTNVSNLFDLFNEDGVIQGIFFDKGNIKFIRNFIRTDKLLYEEKNGKIPFNYFNLFLFNTFNKLNLLPNMFGLSNTAIINVKNKIYTLNEQDMPYEINIDFTPLHI
jgi:carotenoid cleavage dioxygenase-like enzyme